MGDHGMRSRLYAGKPGVSRRYSLLLSYPCFRVNGMDDSDNAESAENQQERLFTTGWLVGCVDGEGCFSYPIFRSSSMRHGWQVQPSFTVVQGESSRDVLEGMVPFFGCGCVYRNRRRDNDRRTCTATTWAGSKICGM